MKDKDYQIDEHVYLKVKAKRSSLSLGRCGKLAPNVCETFEILAKRGPISYELALLKKYVSDTKHVNDWSLL